MSIKPNGSGETKQPHFDALFSDNVSIRNQVNSSKQFSYKPETGNTPVNCVLEPEYIEMIDHLCEQASRAEGKPVKRQAMVKSLLKFALNRA